MAARPPHAPTPGRLADLIRRGRLTLIYHGPRELAWRLLTFPLRPTPLGRRLGYGRRYGAEEARARTWYRQEGRPVCVVIPSYGDPQLALDAAASVRKTTNARRVDVVIVDDGSPPEHQAALRGTAGARVELRPANAGFAATANHGLGLAAPGQDVVVLNSDVIAEKGWLERLQYAAYRAPEVGIVGPKLLYPDRRIQSAGSYRNLGAPEWFDHRYRFKDTTHPPANVAVPVIGATGACLYLKRAALDALGGFDEGYGMAYEDADLCLRGWEAGWETHYAPRSTLVHLESQTRPTAPGPRELASQARFWRSWGPWFDARDARQADGSLRIVYVTEDTGVGGGHRVVFEHLNRLAARGHRCELYSLAGPPDWFDLRVPTRTFATYTELAAALDGVDAIKVATWWNTARSVWLASVRRGIPVYFVQDIETSYYPDSAEMRTHVLASYREEFRHMTTSGWNRERLSELGVNAVLVSPGIDLETFRPRADVARRDALVLAVGRANPLKRLGLTLDAWAALGVPGERPELRLFGIEPATRPDAPDASYVLRPDDERVNELLCEATVFVQTSVHEGFSLPPLEAMATGAAVVCTDAHGNRDFCADGVNCLMPEPTAESVSGALRRLLDDPALRARLGAEGIRTAADYGWERRIDEIEGFFARLSGVRPSQEDGGPRGGLASTARLG